MPTIDLKVGMQDFQVNAFSPLGEDVLSSIRGMASGNFSLKGLLQNPEMNGELTLKNAGLQFPYLNVDYNLAKERPLTWMVKALIFRISDLKI